ncbi:hypothetical protein B0J12DRAFT_114254 [Macrophomina phaseolina]|uniref:NAD(P)-binding domain-containing protein n=1 Tax=Macrophomina phaseolina TaxID=35725 RepID=A0ABQ8G8X5_9PEZI|nr:hypothetical protein B0J12DRAFT_114254 [Macrophomina phaseolina]
MHVILTGATGLVGSGALAQLLAHMKAGGPITQVSVLSRKPVPMAEGKPNVTVIRHTDFKNYPPEILKELDGAEACIWALGISQTQVGKDEYVTITKEYPLAAAKAFSSLSPKFKFIYVSGEGTTQTPGYFTPFFARVKGETETQLLDLPKTHPSLRPFSVRPFYIDRANHPEVIEAQRHRSSMSDYYDILGPVVRRITSIHSPTELLGDFFIKLATGDGEPLQGDDLLGGGRIVPNKAFRRIMREERGV